MSNPARVFGVAFLRRSPMELLVFGLALSSLDSLTLILAAAKEGVLHVDAGVGLLNNYGLISTILGNVIYLYLAKTYYDAVCSLGISKTVIESATIDKCFADLRDEIEMRGKSRYLAYLLIVVGVLSWLSNVASHVFGDPEVRWGYRVFDSPDHPLTFLASRLHNIYAWVVIMPFVGYVVIVSSDQLWRLMTRAAREDAIRYDLLNPDQRGGFGSVDKAAIAFNVVALVAYLQITLHIGTFKLNLDHLIAYIFATVVLIAVNRMFFGGIYSTIKSLRTEALYRLKEKVFENDILSFEVLKYCYKRKMSPAAVLNFLINPGAVVLSGALKLWPLIVSMFSST